MKRANDAWKSNISGAVMGGGDSRRKRMSTQDSEALVMMAVNCICQRHRHLISCTVYCHVFLTRLKVDVKNRVFKRTSQQTRTQLHFM